MGSAGFIYMREIKDEKKWEELKEEFYRYVKKYAQYCQVYEYDNFLGTGKRVLIVYKGDSPCGYGDDCYYIFPEFEVDDYIEILEACEYSEEEIRNKVEEKFPWLKEWERFSDIFGPPFKYEIWT